MPIPHVLAELEHLTSAGLVFAEAADDAESDGGEAEGLELCLHRSALLSGGVLVKLGLGVLLGKRLPREELDRFATRGGNFVQRFQHGEGLEGVNLAAGVELADFGAFRELGTANDGGAEQKGEGECGTNHGEETTSIQKGSCRPCHENSPVGWLDQADPDAPTFLTHFGNISPPILSHFEHRRVDDVSTKQIHESFIFPLQRS